MGLFKKKITKEEKLLISETVSAVKEEVEEVETSSLAVVTEQEKKEENHSKKAKSKKEEGVEDAYHEGEFLDLANLLGRTIREVKDDCLMEQVKKIMASVSSVSVRYAPDRAQYLELISDCRALNVNEVLLSPAYIKDFKKIAKKENFPMSKVSAIVDFPFGEGLFSRKVQEVKQLKREGVNNVLVMMPVLMTQDENLKILKKQTAKLSRMYKGTIGVAFSASDADSEQIKNALKVIEKLPISSVTFVFGEVMGSGVEEFLKILAIYKGKKQISVFGNVEKEEAVIALKKAGIDKIYSPSAIKVGKTLVKRFKIQGANIK